MIESIHNSLQGVFECDIEKVYHVFSWRDRRWCGLAPDPLFTFLIVAFVIWRKSHLGFYESLCLGFIFIFFSKYHKNNPKSFKFHQYSLIKMHEKTPNLPSLLPVVLISIIFSYSMKDL